MSFIKNIPIVSTGSSHARNINDRFAEIINVKDYGAKGDDTTDDTAAIQSVLDLFKYPISRTGAIFFPIGTYRISNRLLFQGTSSYGIRMYGAASNGGPSGSVLKMIGATGVPVALLEFSGALDCSVSDISFVNNGNALYSLYLHQDSGTSVGVSNFTISHCQMDGGIGPNSAGISLGVFPDGTTSSAQCDSIIIDRVKISGHPDTRFGVRTGGNNVKNFQFNWLEIIGCQVGLEYGGSGSCLVLGGGGGACSIADFACTIGNLNVYGYNSEASTKLLACSGVTGNYSNVTIEGCSWAGTPLNDDIIILAAGTLTLNGNFLQNQKSSTSIPRIGFAAVGGADGSGARSSVISSQNHYINALENYTDASGNSVFCSFNGTSLYSSTFNNRSSWLKTFGDIGGKAGAPTLFSLQNRGTLSNQIRTIAGSANIYWDDKTILGDTTSASFPLILPDATKMEPGWECNIKNIGTTSNLLTVQAILGQKFDNITGDQILNNANAKIFRTDNSNWFVF